MGHSISKVLSLREDDMNNTPLMPKHIKLVRIVPGATFIPAICVTLDVIKMFILASHTAVVLSTTRSRRLLVGISRDRNCIAHRPH